MSKVIEHETSSTKKTFAKSWGDTTRNPRVQRKVCKCKERSLRVKKGSRMSRKKLKGGVQVQKKHLRPKNLRPLHNPKA
jgi:hypothetical protein